MENILLIMVCLLLGLAFQRVRSFPADSHKVLNLYVINAALPGLTLYYIPKLVLDRSLFFPLGISWGGYVLSFLFFSLIGKKLNWPKALTGCLIITAGLGNTAFVGFPVIQALYGEEGLKTAIVLDQAGSFVVMATLATITAIIFSEGKPGIADISKKILMFPPFISFLAGMALCLSGHDFPVILQPVFQKLGATIVPVALVSVGLQLKIDRRTHDWRYLGWGLFFKLFLMPAFFYILYKIIFAHKGMTTDVCLMEAAMAPMITGAILASSYQLRPKLANLMVGVGIPLSFLTLSFWYWVLS